MLLSERTSHAHGHQDVDRGRILRPAHQRRRGGIREHEARPFTFDLLGDVEEVARIEPDLERTVGIVDLQLLDSAPALWAGGGKLQAAAVQSELYRARPLG